MRIPLSSAKATEHDLVELANQDVDMRILAMPHRTSASDKSKFKKTDADSFKSNNTQLEKTNEQASSRKLIDYSQYLKDANIDLNQSDLEDPIGTCNDGGYLRFHLPIFRLQSFPIDNFVFSLSFFLSRMAAEALHKEKKKSYDSDEDEVNPLIIEEDEMSGQPDDSQSDDEKVSEIHVQCGKFMSALVHEQHNTFAILSIGR